MEWFYRYGLAVLGWVAPDVAVSTPTEMEILMDDVSGPKITYVTQPKVMEDSVGAASIIPPAGRVNPNLDSINNHKVIPVDFLMRYINPMPGVPEEYIVGEKENQLIERKIQDGCLVVYNTTNYSLIVDPTENKQYYCDSATIRWAANKIDFKLNKREERALPTQVGNSLYLYDAEGNPHITFDGRVWKTGRRIPQKRMEWLLEYGSVAQLNEELFGGNHETKHSKRTGKQRGTRSRKNRA